MSAFLAQYWGGARDYSELRGHPRLRMRHAAFRMDADTGDRWLRHMRIPYRTGPRRSWGSVMTSGRIGVLAVVGH